MLAEIMEMFKLSVIALVLCAQVYAGLSLTEDRDVLTAKSLQENPSKTDALVHFADLVKRLQSQQFHGLMGRSAGNTQPVRRGSRRNKGEIFVGLMGRRSSSGDFKEEWHRPQLY